MTKQKKVSVNSQRKITVVFGYGLFVAALVAVTVSTIIPWSLMLLNPSAKHLNVVTILATFVAAAIIPFLVAYIVGDKITRTTNKVTHHYNGVLFAVMAYWLSLLFSSIGSLSIAPIRETSPEFWVSSVINLWPILATIIVISVIAVSYHMRTQKAGESVLEYRPYQFVLTASLIAPLLLTLPQIADGYLLASFLNIIVPAIFIGISYMTLRKVQQIKRIRLTYAIVAVSFGIIAMQFAGQMTGNMPYGALVSVMAAVGAIVWASFLGLSVRQSCKVR